MKSYAQLESSPELELRSSDFCTALFCPSVGLVKYSEKYIDLALYGIRPKINDQCLKPSVETGF